MNRGFAVFACEWLPRYSKHCALRLLENRETLYANVNSVMAIEPEEVRLRVTFDPDDVAYLTVVVDILFYNQVEID